MLQGMERFNGIFVCTTNLLDRIDQAALRRFTFKIQFKPLTRAQRETHVRDRGAGRRCARLTAELRAAAGQAGPAVPRRLCGGEAPGRHPGGEFTRRRVPGASSRPSTASSPKCARRAAWASCSSADTLRKRGCTACGDTDRPMTHETSALAAPRLRLRVAGAAAPAVRDAAVQAAVEAEARASTCRRGRRTGRAADGVSRSSHRRRPQPMRSAARRHRSQPPARRLPSSAAPVRPKSVGAGVDRRNLSLVRRSPSTRRGRSIYATPLRLCFNVAQDARRSRRCGQAQGPASTSRHDSGRLSSAVQRSGVEVGLRRSSSPT